MKMTGKAFAKKLFGARYERLPRTLLIDLIVFWGLYIAGFRVQIAPFIRILMVCALTAGVMWQALSSKDNVVEIRHMLMLPLDRREVVFSYVVLLGTYAIVTKTGLLLAVLLAVSAWTPVGILSLVLGTVCAVLVAAAVYVLRRYWYVGGVWAAILIAGIFFFGERSWLLLLLSVNGMCAVLVLWRATGYDLYRWESGESRAVKGRERDLEVFKISKASLWRYLFRYLGCHKDHLANTAVMWGVAVVLPHFLGEMAGLSVAYIGFAVLTLNTPICILLSCDRDLERAVRFLPGQERAFGIPYCLFIFTCNMTADVIFLCSWQIQNGGVTIWMIAGAVFFALQSAVLSVLLEWTHPIRDWKIESDLWHHPRKYIVPVVMMLLAGAVAAWPVLLPVLLVLLAAEIAVLVIRS